MRPSATLCGFPPGDRAIPNAKGDGYLGPAPDRSLKLRHVRVTEPFDVSLHPLLEIDRRFPLEVAPRFLRGHDFPAVVSGPGGLVLDFRLSKDSLNRLRDFLDGDRPESLKVVDLVLSDVSEGKDIATSKIRDVEEIAILKAITEDREGLPSERLADENRNHR